MIGIKYLDIINCIIERGYFSARRAIFKADSGTILRKNGEVQAEKTKFKMIINCIQVLKYYVRQFLPLKIS